MLYPYYAILGVTTFGMLVKKTLFLSEPNVNTSITASFYMMTRQVLVSTIISSDIERIETTTETNVYYRATRLGSAARATRFSSKVPACIEQRRR